MQDITPEILSILDVHHSLWDRGTHVTYKDKDYGTFIPAHGGFMSVILPNASNKNFMWITQNLNKDSHTSIEIKRARSVGDDKRITWIIDNNNDKFEYCGLIKTCLYFDGKKDILIEKYRGSFTEVVYTTDKKYTVSKSRY